MHRSALQGRLLQIAAPHHLMESAWRLSSINSQYT
jgi:hypothetical protein